MGSCSSCLGRDPDHDYSEEDEQSRLLDDTHPNHYGGVGDYNSGAIQADPQEVQRENEALLKVVTQTSHHLVDIFAMAPQAIAPVSTAVLPAQDTRLLRYQDVLSRISASHQTSGPDQPQADISRTASDGWLSDEEDMQERKGHTPVKSEGVGPLLGRFADADSALD